jgi:CRISPR-associated protein Cmr3
MPVWILEPHDPLLARDNRPFGSDEGAAATSLPLPNPGTLAGAWRTRVGRGGDGPFQGDPVALKRLAIRGPLLAALQDDGGLGFGVPAPADAVLFETREPGKPDMVRCLAPIAVEDALMDLPEGLAPVGFKAGGPAAKPSKDAPEYWAWATFERWLEDPKDGAWQRADGFVGPAREARTHVSIAAETGTAEEGRLFSTEGRRFLVGTSQGAQRFGRLALTVEVAEDEGFVAGVSPVGGERRLASWSRASGGWPPLPSKLAEAIAQDGRCRLVLLTPGVFAAGNMPGDGLARAGLQPVLKAVVNQRPHVISGWDLTKGDSGAKPTRRAVPAGAVYYLELPGSPEARMQWLRETWLQCVSDAEQDRLDGYGLAALGRWPG